MKTRAALSSCALAALAAIALAGPMTLAAPARADTVTDRIDKGRAFYEKGQLSRAARELQWAIGRINKRIADGIGKTFPKAPDGWTMRRVRTGKQSGVAMLQGMVIQRRYRETGGRGRVNAQLIVDNPMIAMMTMMFSNPNIAQNAGYERIEVEGLPQGALIRYQEGRKRGDLVAMLAGRAFLKLDARNVASDEILRDMIKRWEITALKKQLGLQ